MMGRFGDSVRLFTFGFEAGDINFFLDSNSENP